MRAAVREGRVSCKGVLQGRPTYVKGEAWHLNLRIVISELERVGEREPPPVDRRQDRLHRVLIFEEQATRGASRLDCKIEHLLR